MDNDRAQKILEMYRKFYLNEVQTDRTGNRPSTSVVSGMYGSKVPSKRQQRQDDENRAKEAEAERAMWREQTFPKPRFKKRRS